MSAPNKRDLRAFSSVKVPSSAPAFKGFAPSTWLLQLLFYSMGSINLGVVMLLLPRECGNPMNTLSVSSCGYVWRQAKSESADPLLISYPYCSYSGLQTGFRPGCSTVLLENSSQNAHGRELTGVAGRQRHGCGETPTPEFTERCQNCSIP